MGLITSAAAVQLAVLALLIFVTLHLIRQFYQKYIERIGFPLPPGPTPLPLLGSAHLVNTERIWTTFTEWKEKYGDIMYVRLLDVDVVVVNSLSIATDLLEKRSKIYSDRPHVPNVDHYGEDFNVSFARYGDHWRLCRRILRQSLHKDASVSFRPMQLRKARQLISSIIDSPEEYPSHLFTLPAAVAYSAVYGYESSARNDPLVTNINNFLLAILAGLRPEKVFLIKIFPFLLHVPEWLPGSWIRRETKASRALRDKVIKIPYQYVQEHLKSGHSMNTSLVSDHIARMEKCDDPYRSQYELALKYSSASSVLAASDTISSALLSFTLAMVENPHVWKRAQVEIDAVVGIDRLPGFEDRPSLPYVEAIMREVSRWRPNFPLSGPHATLQSDIYKGYYIPKGATIVVNVWGVTRDRARYSEPDKFIPERFLNAKGALTDDDPAEFVFGFGRRKCPGDHIGDAIVWSAIATMLATIDFNLAKGADGNDIKFKATWMNGVTERPNTFPCRLTPRPHVTREFLDCGITE